MSSGRILKEAQGFVRPVLSTNAIEARRRVLNLYRSWYRQIPYIYHEFNLPYDKDQLKAKLREKFYENKHVKDLRVIDMLVIKGHMELTETAHQWKQECHVQAYFRPTYNPKPRDFISKFLAGHDAE
ncbi:NADH dehydrogenase [ubiquinone] 1 alpha subcomplex subunit 6-like protein [Leptotrombidium deliense]|uniref:NADH dehydrogenase [ubiquinone] 1 alpha subcomplex subunit 6 n=1 Tax=Leptotrombidium deliense TaxID=299467 RepID=A0A443SAN5_9ACAR|nr:NADH dehydrogenase [ubiquinone] 1 alpha subcomplex subunit 6-like protein [Leptotrombidium deliense]